MTVNGLHGERRPPLLRNLSFMLMWASVAASGFGDRIIQLVAWSLLGIDQEGADASSIQASVYFFFFLPYLVFSPLGGWLADTFSRKWIMFGCDQARAALLGLTFLLVPAGAVTAIPTDDLWGRAAVFLIVFAVGLLAAVFNPTRNATVPQLVRTDDLQAANAIILGLAVIASLIGMLAGGLLIDAFDSLAVGLAVGCAAFAVSGCFFIFLRMPRVVRTGSGEHPSQWRRLIQGASYIRRHRPVLQLVVLGVLFWAASHVLVAAIAALNKAYYELPSPLLRPILSEGEGLVLHMAVMNAVLGAGMLTAALLVSFFNTRREAPLVMMSCLLLTGLMVLGLGFAHSYGAGLIFSFLVGLFGNTMIVYVNSQTQSISPDFVRGRVFGVREIFGTIAAVGMNLLIWQWPGTDLLMVPALYVLAGGFLLLAVFGLIWQLRRGPLDDVAGNTLWRLNRLYVFLWHRLRVRGKHHLPRSGPAIIAANHTTGLDPLLMQTVSQRPLRWLMLKSYELAIFRWVWRVIRPITIEPSAGHFASLKGVVTALQEGDVVGMFPEGRLQRDNRELGRFKTGTVWAARQADVPIIPAWISGTPKRRNMIWHFLMPSRSRLVFGEPIHIDPDKDDEQMTEHLREQMLALSRRDHA